MLHFHCVRFVLLAVSLVIAAGLRLGPVVAQAKDGPEKSASVEGNAKSDSSNVKPGDNKSGDQKPAEWVSLFDGKALGKWEPTKFGGQAEISIKDGAIMLPQGNDMTGVTWSGKEWPKMNYELALDAQRVDGTDFFCGLTFSVKDDPCSLILGGWGGSVVGLSSLDGLDAYNNDTTKIMSFKNGQWYQVKLRVTPKKIEAWIDNEKVVDADTSERKIGIRGEVDLSKPLGICTWQTSGAVKNIRYRMLPESK